jgi:PAS domain S-box-containing protein
MTWSDSDLGQGPAGTSIKTRSTVVNQDYRTNPKTAPWSEAANQRGYRSSIALPLIIDNDVLGMLKIYSAEPFAFSDEEVKLLEELAKNLSFGIETLRTRVKNEAAQIALKKESEKNSALLRNASDGIYILDTDGCVIEASDSFCTILGYHRDEVIGMNISQWDAHVTEAELPKVMMAKFNKAGRFQFETRHRRKDGAIFDVEVSSYPLVLDGNPVLFNSSRDITERKFAEKSLRENELFIRTIVNNIPGKLSYWTRDLGCTFANSEYLTWFGYTMKQMRGISIQELLGDKLYRENEPHIRAVLRGENQMFERELAKPDEGTVYTLVQYIAHKLDERVQGFFVLVTDITQVKLAEAELRVAISDVESKEGIINQLKVYSADLNTTLNMLIKNKEKIVDDSKIALAMELERLVMPFLSRLKKDSRNTNHQAIIEVVEGNLQMLISSYGQTTTFATASRNLTPKEIQISSMIRQGLSSKEIAVALSLSLSTISNHRKSIRKKLGLETQAANLHSKLLSLQD